MHVGAQSCLNVVTSQFFVFQRNACMLLRGLKASDESHMACMFFLHACTCIHVHAALSINMPFHQRGSMVKMLMEVRAPKAGPIY